MPTQSPLNEPQLSVESAAKTIAPAKASTLSKTQADPRLDPRIKKFFAAMPAPVEKPNVSSREELLAQENSPAALPHWSAKRPYSTRWTARRSLRPPA
jgi:hypothetical protein